MQTFYRPQGIGIGYRRQYTQDLIQLAQQQSPNPIQFLELAPENWIKMGGKAKADFEQVAQYYPLASHGLSLSLGGIEPLNVAYLKQIRQFLDHFKIQFFSEHTSFCEHGGHVYDLMPFPFTAQSVENFADRVKQSQDILGRQIAIENTSYYIRFPNSTLDEVDFLNAVMHKSDCLLHLDVNNIYVNATNHQDISADDFLNRIDLSRACYIHIAGHDVEQDTQGKPLLIDTHGQAVCADVWQILSQVYERTGKIIPTVLERDFNLPPFADILQEVQQIEHWQRHALSSFSQQNI
ncbi:MAG: DUF692 domain-containing protein [Acinetobacter sp.]|nr:DUF692 domain-containing protein [Acinetobacter sp.]